MKNPCCRVWPYALTIMIAGALLVLSPISGWAAHLGASHTNKAEDVRTTLHNLGSSSVNVGTNITLGTNATSEVCVFCHTPHGASDSNPGAAPLWNRAMPDTTGFSMYSAPNFDGFTAATNPVGVSLACLSCHDGTIALDALINGPGSGRFFNANDTTTAGPGTSLGLLADGTDFIDANISMSEGTRTDTGANYTAIVGAAEPFPNLTRDLSDDHPISFRMPVNAIDQQFPVTAEKIQVGNIVQIVRGYTYDDKRDAIRLYPPAGGTSIADVDDGWVECASCHNPHAARPLFLRLPSPSDTTGVVSSTSLIPSTYGGSASAQWGDDPNSGSAVCLTCHEK